MEKIIAVKEWNKVFQQDGFKHRIRVRAELRSLSGQEPRFSITGNTSWQAGNNKWMQGSGGAIHDEILQHFPQLQLLVDMHLSDDEGVPMHAYKNASYWAGQTEYHKLDLSMLTKHLRISEKLANDMLDYIVNFWGEFDETTTPAMAWEGTCKDYGLLEQWKEQAKVAKLMLNVVEKISA